MSFPSIRKIYDIIILCRNDIVDFLFVIYSWI